MSETLTFGACCVCGKVDETVRIFVLLPWKLPPTLRGHGWGCVVCGLASDGATAVICDQCEASHRSTQGYDWVKDIVAGIPKHGGRLPLQILDRTDLNSHQHDMAIHREYSLREYVAAAGRNFN